MRSYHGLVSLFPVLACLVCYLGLPLRSFADPPPDSPIYLDPQAPVDARVADLLPRMTPQEKLDLLGGDGNMASHGNSRLRIPVINMSDGPLGVRWDHATAFPAGIAMAASFDPELVGELATAMGVETKALGRDMLLGPNVNISRVPLGGRSFEGFGEDPFLSATLATSYVSSLQAQHVIASTKHFALNDEEYARESIDIEADERAMNEIYFPPFLAAVKAGTGTIMMAYNQANGHFCTENDFLIHHILEGLWGFQGFIVSDWSATHSTVDAANAGLDLEMPQGDHFNAKDLAQALSSGAITQTTLDEKIRRILRVIFQSGLFDQTHSDLPPVTEVNSPAHQALALRSAQEGIVLLKNENHVLPIGAADRRIAIIGPNAKVARTGGGGSSRVDPFYSVTPFDGLMNRLTEFPEPIDIRYSIGAPMPDEQDDNPNFGDFANFGDIDDAADAARSADIALVFVGLSDSYEGEGADRSTMDLPNGQDDLIRAVAEANPNTVVVVEAGTPVRMTGWINQVRAVVQAWYPGQEGGNAIADVLVGRVNPSGKLPVTFPREWQDSPGYSSYPITPPWWFLAAHTIHYDEGIYVGYRYYDTRGVEPLFPFGHGLSYTQFLYGNLKVQARSLDADDPRIDISLDLTNIGKMDGAEVVQIYVRSLPPNSLNRAFQELKGFQRVDVPLGSSPSVHLSLDRSAFQYYDVGTHSWAVAPGDYEIRIGSSSRDIRLTQTVTLQ